MSDLYLQEDLDSDSLEHYGTPRHSGRYPWGSGENPYQRDSSFLSQYKDYHEHGYSDAGKGSCGDAGTGVFRKEYPAEFYDSAGASAGRTVGRRGV